MLQQIAFLVNLRSSGLSSGISWHGTCGDFWYSENCLFFCDTDPVALKIESFYNVLILSIRSSFNADVQEFEERLRCTHRFIVFDELLNY